MTATCHQPGLVFDLLLHDLRCCPDSERVAKQLSKKNSASLELTGKPQWQNFWLANRLLTGHGLRVLRRLTIVSLTTNKRHAHLARTCLHRVDRRQRQMCIRDSLTSAVADWMSPYFHTWCGLSANLRCRSETCCTWLAENTGRNKSPKGHLCTIAQLGRAISSQLKHVSTIGKKPVKQQCLLHMSSQYGELRPTNG